MTGRAPGATIVVIPAYNEEASLAGVLDELADVVPELDVVVVDDGSTDDTVAVARRAGVVCLELPFNLGIGGALRAGYRFAAEEGYDRAVQFDADGQHRADQVRILLDRLDEGADLAIGNRFGGGDYRVGRSRRIGMAFLRLGVWLLTRRRFGDTSSGFRAVRRPLLTVFADLYPVEYMDSVETLVAACRAGYRVDESPTRMRKRSGGQPSQSPFRLVFHYARLMVALAGASKRAWPGPEAARDAHPHVER